MVTALGIIGGFLIIGHLARKTTGIYLKTINDIIKWKERNLE